MGRQITLPFTGPAYAGRSSAVNAQECINLIHNVDQASGKSALSLIGRPCLSLFSTIGANPIRGMLRVGDYLYAVSYATLYQVTNNGVATSIGTLDTNTGYVDMAFNGVVVMIVDGTSGYYWNVDTSAFNKITDAGFSGGNTVAFTDSLFVVNNPSTGVAQSSAIRASDPADSWSALDKATAEGDPDNLVRVMAIYSELHLMGEFTVEPWYYASFLPLGFPFLQRAGGRSNLGLAGRWGVVIADNTLYWLAQGTDGLFGVVRATGGAPQKISTPAIDYQIGKFTGVSDCVAWTVTLEGHTFVGFTFTTGGKTWVYDTATGLWAEWRSGTTYFKAAFHQFYNNQHVLGDLTTGKIYTLSFNSYSDAGDVVFKIRTTQHISDNGRKISFNRLWIDFESGVGLNSGQGSDPQAMLQWSDDGGKHWSNEYWRSIGKIGEYKRRAIWTRLGASRDRIFRVTVSDSVKCVIVGAYADIS